MYFKVFVFICATGLASAIQVHQYDTPSYGAYTLPAATSHQKINVYTSSAPLITRTVAAPVTYRTAPAVYAVPAVESYHHISKPAVSTQSVNIYHYNPRPVVTRTYAPAVATYSPATVAAPISYTTAPITYAATAPADYTADFPAAVAPRAAYAYYARSHSDATAFSRVRYSGPNVYYEY